MSLRVPERPVEDHLRYYPHSAPTHLKHYSKRSRLARKRPMRLPVVGSYRIWRFCASQNSPGFGTCHRISPILVAWASQSTYSYFPAVAVYMLSVVVRSRRWFALGGGSLPAVVALGGGSLSVVVRSRRWPCALGGGSLPAVVRSRWWFTLGGGSLSAVVHSIGDGASPQETETEPGVFGWYGWYR